MHMVCLQNWGGSCKGRYVDNGTGEHLEEGVVNLAHDLVVVFVDSVPGARQSLGLLKLRRRVGVHTIRSVSAWRSVKTLHRESNGGGTSDTDESCPCPRRVLVTVLAAAKKAS